MALSDEEVKTLNKLRSKVDQQRRRDELLLRYYQGRQRVEQLGMAIPPDMRKFLVITNWCRTVVDTINERQQVRWMILPGEETADPQLRAIWDANNLSAHVGMFNLDRMIFGRGFLSVGANEDDEELPLIRVESPRQMAAIVDTRKETLEAAGRFYRSGENGSSGTPRAVLYLPDQTIHVEREGGTWRETQDRDVHNLGAVPVVMHLNRRLSGEWVGESQMTDIIPLVDSGARSLTNLQFGQEAHGVPSIWATGVSKGDFVDDKGKPIPQFEAYFDVIKMLSAADAKWGQFSSADLKNFETALNIYRTEASVVTGFPGRFFGMNTTNPPAEGAIRADETKLVRSVESQNEQVGMTLGWVGALALRFSTGEWVKGNRVRVDWFDPATPTIAQRMDATVKAVQSGILSREGAWDELGWSESRKDKERGYFEAQAADPTLDRIAEGLLNASADLGV
jgi:hypothetical protein